MRMAATAVIRRAASLVLAVSALQLGGCAATSEVRDITDVPPGGDIDGVPFRIADRYRVRLFQLTPDGQYKQVFTTAQYLPNQEKIYAVTFSGNPFSDHEFKIELNDDNTIKTSHLKSTKHSGDVANALADQATAVSTALKADKTASEAASAAKQTAEQTYIDLKGKADVAVAQYNALLLKEDATAVEIVTAKAAMDLAMKKANDAAINIGLPPPFSAQ